jgi:hypothetical protein
MVTQAEEQLELSLSAGMQVEEPLQGCMARAAVEGVRLVQDTAMAMMVLGCLPRAVTVHSMAT